MDASADVVMTDKLVRAADSIVEKRSRVEQTHVSGASVPEAALRHGVNANLLSARRRLYLVTEP
jgi:major membrane immunogen (membrane-anchored lipoprotein)